MGAVAWIGRLRAIVSLVGAVVVCIILWIAAMYVMFTKHQFGKGIALIVIGALIVAVSAFFYYWTMKSKIVALGSGFYGIADALNGGCGWARPGRS